MGLGLTHLLRKLLITKNLLSFTLRKKLIGFDAAALFLQRVDKNSVIPILRKYGATIGKDCDIETGLIFHNCSDFSRLVIGNNCHIGKNCFFDLKASIILSDNVV
ncbi:MAG: hypothetical protein LWX09_05870, partial [Bacteroidia bacterium]|nr:hypothetical protein [Bacteroidia bacterium]